MTEVTGGPSTSRTRRLFFALWPEPGMQSALADAARAVLSDADGAPVPTRNLHCTLVFLGSVPESRIAQVEEIAARVAAIPRLLGGEDSIPITLDRIDHWRKSQILCATSTRDAQGAAALAAALSSALAEGGFAPDLKPFRVHATLARKVQRVTPARSSSAVHWHFREFHLVESRTEPGGSIYSTWKKWPLDAQH